MIVGSQLRGPVGVAQLSFWFLHADEFCRKANETDGIRLVACWDDDRDRGTAKAREFGCEFQPDLDAVLANPHIQAVSVCAEPYLNPELVEAAAAAGKHVLVEKPMADGLPGARRIVRAAERHGVQVMPSYSMRFSPAAQHVKRLLDDGVVGTFTRVRRLHGHSLNYERADFDAARIPDVNRWRDPVRERKDSLFWSGSHSALWFTWMLGVPDTVIAERTTAVRGMPMEDNSAVLLSYGDSVLGVMECSETLLGQQTVAEIYGTEGAIVQLRGNLPSTRVMNHARAPIAVFRRSTNAWEYPDVAPEFIRHELEFTSAGQFLMAMRDDTPVPTDVYEGFGSIALLAAAEESAATGRRITVEHWGADA